MNKTIITTSIINDNWKEVATNAIDNYFASEISYPISCMEYFDDNKIITEFLLSASGKSFYPLTKIDPDRRSYYSFDKLCLTSFTQWLNHMAWIADDDDNTFEKYYDLLSSIMETLGVELI